MCSIELASNTTKDKKGPKALFSQAHTTVWVRALTFTDTHVVGFQ